jgi:sensor c-di-GMP phosphodiesterase-like protein
LTVLAALGAVLVLPSLAWRESARQARTNEADVALGFARQALHRSEEMIAQSQAGIAQLSRAAAPACSADALALMRRIVLTSPYIKAIGPVRDGVLQCSSMGEGSLFLGTQTFRASDGLLVYSNIPLDSKPGNPIIGVERDGFVALFDSTLWLDAVNASPDVALAVLHLERRPDEAVIGAAGFIDRAWVRRLDRQAELTFVEGGRLVALVRSARSPTVGVAAVPFVRIAAQRNAIASRLVPAGLVAGMAIAGALLLLARRQVSLASALSEALRDDEFFMLYQPVVDLQSGRWVGVEALLRWRRATGELIGPDLFIPIAEQTGVITRLTERVLQLVERDTRYFLASHPDFHVAVNLAASDLSSSAIVRQFDTMFARGVAAPSNLIVEITERGMLDVEAARSVIAALRERGIAVAIDDFGTGYAGLSYLESLRVDLLKIDRSFIKAIGTGAPTNEVVGHIIAMASAMGLTMVAEGIETEAQAEYLRRRGVHLAQGWLFGKPQPFSDIATALGSGA